MSDKSPVEIICEQAMRENTDLKRCGQKLNGQYFGDTREAKIIKNMSPEPFFRKHVIHLRDEPVSLGTFQNFDPDVRNTGGYYTLTYIPKGDKYYTGDGRHFMIGQDLIRWRVLVRGRNHWHALAQRVPELGWIERNSTLTDGLFDLAAQHPGINFYFTVKWVEYADMIKAKAEAQGLDIGGRVYTVWFGPAPAREEMNEKYKLAPKRVKSEYAVEDIEAEQVSEGKDIKYEQ